MGFPETTIAWAKEKASDLSKLLDKATGDASTESKKASGVKVVSGTGNPTITLSPRLQEMRKKSRLTPGRKKSLVTLLYGSLTFKYGFAESLESGNWSPFPDELNMVNCYSQAVANYVVLKEAGFDPILMEFVGFQEEGTVQRGGHAFVVVDVGTPEEPELWALDQVMHMYGPVTFDTHSLEIENKAARQGRTARNDFRKR